MSFETSFIPQELIEQVDNGSDGNPTRPFVDFQAIGDVSSIILNDLSHMSIFTAAQTAFIISRVDAEALFISKRNHVLR